MRKISNLMVMMGIGLLIAVGVSAQEAGVDAQDEGVIAQDEGVIAQDEGVTALSEDAGAQDKGTMLLDFTTLPIEGGQFPVLDFDDLVGSEIASSLYSEDEKELIQVSLAIYPDEADNRWRVELASSSRRPEAVRKSGVQSVPVTRTVPGFADAGENVLGVRVFFPDGNFNGWALLRPPFKIPFGDERFEGYGLIENVGDIRNVELTMYGLNHPHGVSVVLEDQNGGQREYFMGYLNFAGWQTLTWENNNYLDNINKRDLEQLPPLYPTFANSLRLVGVRFYRNSESPGGDLITYIRDMRVTYDLQEPVEDRDFEHEDVWNIETDFNEDRQRLEVRRLGNTEVLRFIERKKQEEGQLAQ